MVDDEYGGVFVPAIAEKTTMPHRPRLVPLLCVGLATFAAVSRHPSAPASKPTSSKPTAPQLAIFLGDTKTVTAPPGSATAGSKRIQIAVSYSNTGKRPLWIDGYSETSPFYGIQTRTQNSSVTKPGMWVDYGLGFCGTGAKPLKIVPGAKHSFFVAVPEKYRGQDVRVLIRYYATAALKIEQTATSESKRLIVRP